MRDRQNDIEIRELLGQESSINNDWLNQQRNQLMGAISHIENKPLLSRIFTTFTDQLHTITLPRLAAAAVMLLLGFFIGRNQTSEMSAKNLTLADLINSGQISAVQLDPTNSNGDQFHFVLTTQDNVSVSGNKDENEAIQLIHYMLENTENLEDRKELVETLSESDLSSDLAVTALSKALLNEEDPEIQNTLIESIEDKEQPVVKEALIGIVMGDYVQHIRMKALNVLGNFIDDVYIRSMLSIVAATDEAIDIRVRARELLAGISLNNSQIEKIDSEGEIK